MSIPHDPSATTQVIINAMAPQTPGVCGLCLGAGRYLEVVAGDPARELLPVRCACCDGTGRRPGA